MRKIKIQYSEASSGLKSDAILLPNKRMENDES